MQTWISGLSGQNKLKENKTTQNGLPPTQSWTGQNKVNANKIMFKFKISNKRFLEYIFS